MTANLNNKFVEETLVLDDIHRRTGLRFRQLASIDRNRLDVMEKVGRRTSVSR